jgi:putative nucleotidyltransferase with HDIG domain
LEKEKILIIDNDEKFSHYLKDNLTLKGYTVSVASSASTGLAELKAGALSLIILKSGMPDINSTDLIKEIKKINPDSMILVVLEKADSEFMQTMLRLGVYETIAKPVNLEKLFLLVKKSIELHSIMNGHRRLMRFIDEQNSTLQKQNSLLTKRVDELTKNLTRLYESLRSTYLRTIRALAQAIDARDHYTHSHSENVSRYAVKIAQAMQLPLQDIETIRQACELHDIGKIGINDQILSKEASLTTEEKDQIKLHSLKGAQILEPLSFLGGVIDLVRQHHEHYDGSGYPNGHKEEGILLGARIIHLADAYDAMISARAYRKVPLTKEEAIAEIKNNSGTQFDPKVVEAFLKVAHEF